VVEDGTGLAAANGYISVADADTYFSDRGITTWTGTDTVKGQAIIKATDYIETRWGHLFKGYRQFPDTPQGLNFPRLGLYDREGYQVTGIPTNLERATAEYALRALSATLMPDPTIDDSGYAIAEKRVKVASVEEETVFHTGGASPVITKPYPAADKLLREYVASTGRAVR